MPHTNPRDWDPDETPDEDDEPLETYFRDRAEETHYQLELNPPTDPALRERLERELDAWKRAYRREVLPGHWMSGEGDRTLF